MAGKSRTCGCVTKEQVVNHYMMESAYAWQPRFSTQFCIAVLSVFTCVFACIGGVLLSNTLSRVVCTVSYGKTPTMTLDVTYSNCSGTSLSTTVIQGPIHVFYEIDNFYQNDAVWMNSRCDEQFEGQVIVDENQIVRDCGMLNGIGPSGLIYQPCGAGPRSFFTDTYEIRDDTGRVDLDDSPSAIAWDTDLKFLYKEPSDEDKEKHSRKVDFWLDSFFKKSSYDFSKSGKGIENAHFMVWMHTASRPSFKKLFGVIHGDINLPFHATITADYDVERFNGKKRLLIEQASIVGGSAMFLSIAYIVVASFFLVSLIYLLYSSLGR